MVDPSQLTSALINLAVNARDAMPDGGKLTIETRNVVLDEAYAQQHADVGARALRDDRGERHRQRHSGGDPRPGVRPVLHHQGSRAKGTGLGLSMVYGFVKQSGGHIKIYSEEGHGTTIRIYLPRADRADRRDVAAPLHRPSAATNRSSWSRTTRWCAPTS